MILFTTHAAIQFKDKNVKKNKQNKVCVSLKNEINLMDNINILLQYNIKCHV